MAAGFLILIASGCSPYSASSEGTAGLPFSGNIENGKREVSIYAYKYGFFPNPIVVKYGEKVRLTATAIDVTHGFRVPEFQINEILPKGKADTFEFTASKKGTFIVHCSIYCGPRHGEQKARIIVQ